MQDKQVVDTADWLVKLRAVLDERTHLHVTARTDARAELGLDQAIERGKAAADLGVGRSRASTISRRSSASRAERAPDQRPAPKLVPVAALG